MNKQLADKLVDIRDSPALIDEINRILNARAVAEIKNENGLGLTVVQIERKLRFPKLR